MLRAIIDVAVIDVDRRLAYQLDMVSIQNDYVVLLAVRQAVDGSAVIANVVGHHVTGFQSVIRDIDDRVADLIQIDGQITGHIGLRLRRDRSFNIRADVGNANEKADGDRTITTAGNVSRTAGTAKILAFGQQIHRTISTQGRA